MSQRPPSSLEPQQRAAELLREMTVTEKAMQLSAVMPLSVLDVDGGLLSGLRRDLANGIGHVSGIGMVGNRSPAKIAASVNAVQHHLVTQSRLGIPAIFHNEALNGVVAPGFTVFPTPIGLAATWDPDAIEEMAAVIGRQMRGVGLLQALAPVSDVARDARWGRVHETYGEDPYLVTAMTLAFTRGIQGPRLGERVLATAKHFLGYAMTDAGQNMATTAVGARELYEVYARPFEAAIREAGLASVMNSYSDIDGVPVAISHEILTDLLRDRLGFQGTVVSDYSTVAFLHNRQGVADSAADAGLLALAAGLDIELPSVVGYGTALAEAVERGALRENDLDRSVLRVLRDKFALGLFERPYVDDDPIVLTELASEGAELSARLARESVTLLKNDGAILPLARQGRVAVIGPHAEGVLVGFPGYTYPAAVELMRGMSAATPSDSETVGNMAGVDFTAGGVDKDLGEAVAALAAEVAEVLSVDLDEYVTDRYSASSLADAIRHIAPRSEVTVARGTGVVAAEPTDIDAAVAAAADADVIVVALGGRGGWFGGAVTEGEGSDTADIDLPAPQVELIDALARLGKPMIGVFSMGRPLGLSHVIDLLDAVLVGFYGGPQHGRALAEALFGVINPGGKLPYSIPRHSGQIPIHSGQHRGSGYRRTPEDLHKGYLDMPATPLYAFGDGLSYTSFAYSELRLLSDAVTTDGVAEFSIDVTNTGHRTGTEIVQLYLEQTARGVTRPAQELIGFARIDLDVQQSATVRFSVAMSQLVYVGFDGDLVVEPGEKTARAGGSSVGLPSHVTFEVTGPPVAFERRQTFLAQTEVTFADDSPTLPPALAPASHTENSEG
ncbi:MAG TPA: glycoside hydrolase family 3 N-terminal domain-containing protein [Lacisediminihabitans sp.]|uniref:beta-glucosidase family protein n=1 Tax=Lacisediminihabitans sp. TaxID=2787631 RepID=UPI002ED9D0D6